MPRVPRLIPLGKALPAVGARKPDGMAVLPRPRVVGGGAAVGVVREAVLAVGVRLRTVGAYTIEV